MEKTAKAVAWICMFSMVMTGCYTSEMIDPTATGKGMAQGGEIEYVVMRDGTKYEFRHPPTIANDILVGEALLYGTFLPTHGMVTVPMADVTKVSVSRYNSGKTWTWIAVGATFAVTVAIMANNIYTHY